MKVHTAVGQYKASPEALFNLLSKEENLPKWATKFCASIEKRQDDYILTTTEGQELFFKIKSNAETGTIDMSAGPSKEMMWGGPHRVASDNLGGSLFVFTHIQAPGQADEEFEAGCKGLAEEFEVIRSLVE
ncbi:hypothetical protein MNBD_GAMMA06-196 [hydrothermal vent metagenome]|uniref:SRPBCC family protein n=1 Tax=hydrothermal vent metagenome TaxID=652676 RepID=A0A3B0X8G3_9ZZZZ